MRTIRKILCVVDPAKMDSPAVRRAVWLAKTMGADLELLAVVYADLAHSQALQDQALLDGVRSKVLHDLRGQLALIADRIQRDFKVSACANVVWDNPLHEGVIRYANAGDVDILMKDAAYDDELRMTVMSNQDWQLILGCSQPLWIVKRPELPAETHFIAALDPLHKNDKPAELDDAILELGKTLAAASGVAVHAFHSFDPRIATSTAVNNVYIPVSLPLSDIEEQMREQHTLRFAQILDSHDIPEDRQHLVTGLTDEELPRLATRLNATAVIMGAIARNSVKRVFIGSTAERTLNRLPSDLIVVKPDWFESPVPAENAAEHAPAQ